MPYLSRVLGVEGIGVASYVITINQIFIMAAGLGMVHSGNRTIGYYKELAFSKHVAFSNLAVLQTASAVVSLIIYYAFIIKVSHYKELFLLSSISVLASGFDYSWYFLGSADMKKPALRNIFIRVVCLISIFIFVKQKSDVSVYLLINAISIFIANFFVLWFLPVSFRKVYFSLRFIKNSFLPVLFLFLPQILFIVYASVDKILLVNIANNYSLGLYESSQRIVTILTTLTLSLSPIMVSKLSGLSRGNDLKSIEYYSALAIELAMYIGIPVSFGLAGVSAYFVPWFFGAQFASASNVLILLCPVIFLAGMGDVMVTQLAVSLKRDKTYLAIAVMMIIFSIILNVLLLPHYKHFGAAIANTITNIIILSIEFYLFKDVLKFETILPKFLKIGLASSIMLLCIYAIPAIMSNLITMLIKILSGFLIFVLISQVLKVEIQLLIMEKVVFNLKKMFK